MNIIYGIQYMCLYNMIFFIIIAIYHSHIRPTNHAEKSHAYTDTNKLHIINYNENK